MGRKPGTKTRKKDEQKLLGWAEKLFPYLQTEGLRGLTMDKAATILSSSKSTLYQYLRTKEEILAFIVDYKIRQLSGFNSYLQDDNLSYKKRLEYAVQYFCEKIKGMTYLFLKDLKQEFPTQWEKVEVFIDDAVSSLDQLYRDGIDHGEFKNFNPSLLSLMDRHFFLTLTNPDLLEKEGLSFDEAIATYLNIKLHGLLHED